VGFSRLSEKNEWQFSSRAVTLLQEYLKVVPRLGERLNELLRRFRGGGVPAAKEVFEGEVDKQMAAVLDFIKKKVKMLPHVPVGHEALDDRQVELVEETLEQTTSEEETLEGDFSRKQLLTKDELLRKFSMRAKFRESFRSSSVKLGSRVRVYVSGVPSGARGTVVAVYAFADGAVQLEILLDKKTLGAESLHGRSSNLRGVIVAPENLILMNSASLKRPATAPVVAAALQDAAARSFRATASDLLTLSMLS
jgi:hypothetical protein